MNTPSKWWRSRSSRSSFSTDELSPRDIVRVPRRHVSSRVVIYAEVSHFSNFFREFGFCGRSYSFVRIVSVFVRVLNLIRVRFFPCYDQWLINSFSILCFSVGKLTTRVSALGNTTREGGGTGGA